jgi:hypothetical protein
MEHLLVYYVLEVEFFANFMESLKGLPVMGQSHFMMSPHCFTSEFGFYMIRS